MTPNTQPTYCLLLGPTASGKTRWALDHLSHQKIDIISIDSCQVYRELSVGSAKVSQAECTALPHYVIDCVSVKDTYDVARYLKDAHDARTEISAQGRMSLHLGGSMLYADKLMHGLSDVPVVPEAIWRDVDAQYQAFGVEYIWHALLDLDPSYSERLHPNDQQRISRALAVLLHTQKPLYSYWDSPLLQPKVHLALIMPHHRNDLLPHVHKRTDDMLKDGIIEETRIWYDGASQPSLQALRSVGYRETWSYVHGDISTLEELKIAIVHATMRYIKQQITWMKRWAHKADIIVKDTSNNQDLLHWWHRAQRDVQ